MNKIEKQIIDSIDHFADDILDFTSRLVAEPSTLGNEASAMEVMEAELKKLAFEPTRILIDPAKLSQHPGFAPVPWSYDGRYNVAARREASAEGGRSVIFNGHLDVVSPEPLKSVGPGPLRPG